MVKTLIDQKLVERTIKETEQRQSFELAKEMLLDNEPIEKILKYTKLTEKDIQNIQKTLEKRG